MPARKLLYTVIMSEHNVAELQACLRFRPTEVLVIASNAMRKPAEYFRRELQATLPSTRIHILPEDAASLGGEDADEINQWLAHDLRPRLAAYPAQDWERILNLTGGTKILSLLCQTAIPWDALHYQAHKAPGMQVLSLAPNGALQVRDRLSLAPLDILQHARLYLEKANPKSSPKLWQHPDLPDLGMRLLAWSLDADSAWEQLCAAIERAGIWNPGYADHTERTEIPAAALGIPADALKALVTQLNRLHDGALVQTETGLQLPTSRHPATREWRRFIGGGWFEWVTEHLLKRLLPPDQVRAGIQLHAENDDGGRDADMLALIKGQLHVFEIKVAMPPGHKAQEAEQQLASLTHLGKVSKVLVVSARFRRQLDDPGWARFEQSCTARQIRPIVLAGEDSLRTALKLD